MGRKRERAESPLPPEFRNGAQQPILRASAAALKRFAQMLWSSTGRASGAEAGETNTSEGILPNTWPRPARTHANGIGRVAFVDILKRRDAPVGTD